MLRSSLFVLFFFATAGPASEVYDEAGLFSRGCVDEFQKHSRLTEELSGVSIIVDTVSSPPGSARLRSAAERDKFFRELLKKRAALYDAHGLFVLICDKPGRLQVDASYNTRFKIKPSDEETIRKAALPHLRDHDFDGALRAIAAASRQVLVKYKAEKPIDTPIVSQAKVVPDPVAASPVEPPEKSSGYGWIVIAVVVAIGIALGVLVLEKCGVGTSNTSDNKSCSPSCCGEPHPVRQADPGHVAEHTSVLKAAGLTAAGGIVGYSLGRSEPPKKKNKEAEPSRPNYSPDYEDSSPSSSDLDSGSTPEFDGGSGDDF